ncbi:MAG TPA: hypothetical protein PKE20_09860, partial [Promineifilum sp.]|nr:hypothetical protein [Promineifilum sp.]
LGARAQGGRAASWLRLDGALRAYGSAWRAPASSARRESERGGRYEIYAIPFEGGETTRLTDSDGDTFVPIISPDGQWLMFQSTRGGEMDIYRQPWELP